MWTTSQRTVSEQTKGHDLPCGRSLPTEVAYVWFRRSERWKLEGSMIGRWVHSWRNHAGSLRAGLCYGTDDAKYVMRDDNSEIHFFPDRDTVPYDSDTMYIAKIWVYYNYWFMKLPKIACRMCHNGSLWSRLSPYCADFASSNNILKYTDHHTILANEWIVISKCWPWMVWAIHANCNNETAPRQHSMSIRSLYAR